MGWTGVRWGVLLGQSVLQLRLLFSVHFASGICCALLRGLSIASKGASRSSRQSSLQGNKPVLFHDQVCQSAYSYACGF
ncbi:hypothetical protein BJ741DRAFT_594838 [Chytriomyces cf. hyalinus JEL632]|nr:hypothetical protein BJ741DRAFT_594838 [Chytriomyces cf. hyalinus JEL632]